MMIMKPGACSKRRSCRLYASGLPTPVGLPPPTAFSEGLLFEELEVSDIQTRLCNVTPRPARHDCPHIVRKTLCDREGTPPRSASRENALIYSLNSASANWFGPGCWPAARSLWDLLRCREIHATGFMAQRNFPVLPSLRNQCFHSRRHTGSGAGRWALSEVTIRHGQIRC